MSNPAHAIEVASPPIAGNGAKARRLAEGQGWSVSEYICSSGPGDRRYEERHDAVTIAAVLSGAFNYRSETGRAVLFSGTFLLGNAGACFECGHDHSTGDHCIAIHVTPDYFAEIAASTAGRAAFRFPTAALRPKPNIIPWVSRIETAARRNACLDDGVVELIEMVIAATSTTPQKPIAISSRDERRIADAMRHIEAHSDEAIDLDALATVAGMSKYHFLRTFRRLVGMPPHQTLLAARLRKAAVRLTTSDETISAIAFDAGFGDLSSFNARFRKMFGQSPGAYRRRER
jgi:AraC family transcriptional regulator